MIFYRGNYPSYNAVLKKYKSCISQKNQILKHGGNKASLDVWNQSLLALAEEIVSFRVSGCDVLTTSLCSLLDELNLSFGSNVLLRYEVSRYVSDKDSFVSGYRDFLAKRLSEGVEKELNAGYSLYGPHRDDFSIDIDGRSLFHFFSRGVNRVIAILLTLAGVSLKYSQSGLFPILLLDDTFAELDPKMKYQLMHFVQSKTQLFYATVLPEDKHCS